METRANILEIPRLLRETLEKGAGEYEAVVRRIRGGEGPLFICCCGTSFPAGLAGAYLFEWLAGRPVVAQPSKVFAEYAQLSLGSRPAMMVIASSGEDPEAIEIVRAARARGAVPIALTRDPAGPLGDVCGGVFLTRDEGPEDFTAAGVCQQAALSRIALVTARVVKGSGAAVEPFEEELQRLPEQVEWCFTQLSDAICSLADELRSMERFWLVGGGLYHAAVARGARCFSGPGGVRAQGIEVSEFGAGSLSPVGRGEVAVFVSGSRLRIKREVRRVAAQAKVAGARLISLTDSNDRDLIDRSDVAILMPQMSEIAGSVLALTLLGLLGSEFARNHDRRRDRKLSPKGADRPSPGAKA